MSRNVGFVRYRWMRKALPLPCIIAMSALLVVACSRPPATATPTAEVTPTVALTFERQPFLLLITEPRDQSVVSSSPIRLSGRTSADAVVSVNGVYVPVDVLGIFSTMVRLDAGPNIIEVVATDTNGRVLSSIIAVIYRP